MIQDLKLNHGFYSFETYATPIIPVLKKIFKTCLPLPYRLGLPSRLPL